MRLEVPFFKQTTELNCGPMALKMVFVYFGKDPPIELIEEKAGIKEGKAVSTIRLAIVSADLGFKTKLFTKTLGFNEEHLKLEYYQKHSDTNAAESQKLREEAMEKGIELQEKILSLEELLSFVNKDSVPIVLIDWNTIKGKEGYQGHFVPLVGFDDENVYIHNHGLKNSAPFLQINKETFDKARKAEGTDEDIVIIYRQNIQKKSKSL